MTPDELTEKFFTEVLGWKWEKMPGYASSCWVAPSGRMGWPQPNLPPIASSLDAFWKHVEPVLKENGCAISIEKSVYSNRVQVKLYPATTIRPRSVACGADEIPALAALTAAMKALEESTVKRGYV